MREIYVADCETDPFKINRIPKPFVWGLYNGIQYDEFYSTEHFIEHLKSLNKSIIVYAHNGGKFDWHFILDYLEPFTELTIISGRIAKFQIEEIEFRDSYNILPIALGEYQKEKIDYAIFEKEFRNLPENKRKISDYLQSDCVFLYEIVKGFIDTYGLNLTLAGAAMKTWRKLSGLPNCESTKEFYDFFKPFYYGGRVECFTAGIIDYPFKVVDVNSAYPFAMTFSHPYGDNFSEDTELPKKFDEISRSLIKLNAKSTGAFPFRGKNGLCFPNDGETREFFITGWEYQAAIDTGKLIDPEILQVFTFEDSINFSRYVDHFFTMKSDAKKSGDKKTYLFAKLMQNSLYGKYASNPDEYREHMIIDPKYIEASFSDGYEFNGLLGKWGLVEKPLDEMKKHFYNVAVAASITGFQRANLLRSLSKVKNPLYCDTDSIACQDTGTLNISEVLGDWSLEAECTSGAIAGKKLYAFKTNKKDKAGNFIYKTASKGVKFSADEIIEVAKGEEIIYKSMVPTFNVRKEPYFIERKVVLTT